LQDEEAEELEYPPVNPQVHTPPKPGTGTPPSPLKLRQQHAVFPLAEGEVLLSFPADLSVASAQIMASFCEPASETSGATGKNS
jgi:hypothetical protein